MSIDKRDLILESIIQAYLEMNEPIGSSELCSRMSLNIPASTIRVYFKKLSDEGAITQLHISSGRIPTATAMSYYWREKLDLSSNLTITNLDLLSFLVYDFGIYCMIFGDKKLKLSSVINIQNKFLLLDFDEESLSIKFAPKIEKFLNNLIGIDINELDKISAQVGLSELRAKIKEFKHSQIYFQENEKIALEMFDDNGIKSILDPSFVQYFKSNLIYEPLFKSGYMGLKANVEFNGNPAVMICAGSVYNDYEKFLNHIKEVA